MSSGSPIVGRLAPSPTGQLHLGHARSFLLAWWHSRSRGGRVVLRLEDVDVARASQEHIDSALRDLEWLGLDWDGEPQVQSARLERLQAGAHKLHEIGAAYPCICTRRDLQSVTGNATAEPIGAPHPGGREPRYPGTCRGRFRTIEEAERFGQRNAGLRFIVPDEPTYFDDVLRGRQCFNVARAVGDFLILRRDKTPAYQLAIVVDDAEDEVTEVVRGDDLLPSTARQILVRHALGLPDVSHVHVPLVCDRTGRRLAKREQALSLSSFREHGIDPRSIVAWAAQTSGQLPDFEPNARVDAAEILGSFDIQLLPHNPVILDGRWPPFP